MILPALIERMIAAGVPAGEAGALAAEIYAAGVASVTSKSAAAVRQQRYRDRNKGVTNRNETVTERNANDESDTVTKRNESVTKRNVVTAPLSSFNISIERKGRGSRIDPDWKPERDLAKQLGWSDAQIDTEAENFRDYWLGCPGSKGVKLDWPATWRKWVRSSRVKPASTSITIVQPSQIDWRSALRSWKEFGRWPKGIGNDPGSPACRAPPELLREFGLLKTA